MLPAALHSSHADHWPWLPVGGEHLSGLAAPKQAVRDCNCSHDMLGFWEP
ncbi:hypothetical protein TIFTF001_031539 [Ficus carica]|uniref:Uncharacterized protein n=1 Tax=Ficus carica TaxID=3494 RepID=A0AA88DUX5_FICCA|nr:hypothetical protein TIFTF001_031539 [Ficus carica]